MPWLKRITILVVDMCILDSNLVSRRPQSQTMIKISLVSADDEPPYRAIVEAGAVPVLISTLQPPKLHPTALESVFEAAWALTNLAVGDSEVVRAVVPAAPILIAYTEGGNGLALAEQCAWALGNMAEDAEYRSKLIANGAVRPLAKLFVEGVKAASEAASKAMVKQSASSEQETTTEDANSQLSISAGTTAAWALSNLLRNAEHEEIRQFIGTQNVSEALIEAIELPFLELSFETAWLMGHISASQNTAYLNRLVHLGVLLPLCRKISLIVEKFQVESVSDIDIDMSEKEAEAGSPGKSMHVIHRIEDISFQNGGRVLLAPLFRVFGNLIAGGGKDAMQEIFADHGEEAIRATSIAAEIQHHGIQREAAWVLGNVAGLPGRQGVDLLKRIGAIPVLLSLLKDQPFHVRKEAAFALCNIAAGGGGASGDAEALNYLFAGDIKALHAMISLMKSANIDAAIMGLQFTEMFLRCLPTTGAALVEAADGIDALEALQFGKDIPPDIQQAAAHLVDAHWGIKDE